MAGSADIPLFYTIANIICLVSFFKYIKGINDFKAYRTQSGLN